MATLPDDLAGGFTGFSATMPHPGVALVELDNPGRRNAFSLAAKRELVDWMVRSSLSRAVRVIVFTGAGEDFCAGDDISGGEEVAGPSSRLPVVDRGPEGPSRTYNALRLISQNLVRTVRALEVPTFAAVDGYAIQSGLSLALACDFRSASTRARFGSATLRFALTPDDGGLYLLVQHLGLAGALDFVMNNRIVDATAAKGLGLVADAVEPSQLLNQVLQRAIAMTEMPQFALRMVKRSIYLCAERDFEQAAEDIAVRTALSDAHPDALAGIQAFRSKTTPVFNQWLESEGA